MTTGEAIRRQLIEQNGLNPQAVVSVPTGIDVEHFSPRPCAGGFKSSLGLLPDAKIISNVAIWRRWKGHDALVSAARLCGERGREHVVARYSYERMIDCVLDLYETLMPHVGRG